MKKDTRTQNSRMIVRMAFSVEHPILHTVEYILTMFFASLASVALACLVPVEGKTFGTLFFSPSTVFIVVFVPILGWVMSPISPSLFLFKIFPPSEESILKYKTKELKRLNERKKILLFKKQPTEAELSELTKTIRLINELSE